MKSSKFVFSLIFVFIFIVFTNNAYAQDPFNQTTIDTLENGDLQYTHVGIVVEYGWIEPDELKNVTAVVHYAGKTPVSVIATKKDESKEEFYLKAGIVVKIFDNRGKLIKILSDPTHST